MSENLTAEFQKMLPKEKAIWYIKAVIVSAVYLCALFFIGVISIAIVVAIAHVPVNSMEFGIIAIAMFLGIVIWDISRLFKEKWTAGLLLMVIVLGPIIIAYKILCNSRLFDIDKKDVPPKIRRYVFLTDRYYNGQDTLF